VALAATFGLSVLLFFYADRREDEALRTAFADRARTLASAVRASCDGHLEVLVSLESLFSSVPRVRSEEFDGFVARALARHPGIRGLSWNPRITAAERARFEAESGARINQIGAQGREPAGARDEYVVVGYIAPSSDRGALGLDVAAEPVRGEAVRRSRDSGRLAATSPIQLVNDRGGQLSVLVFAPVYGPGSVPATVERRRREVRGYATAAFRLGDLVETAIADLPRDGLAVALFDRSAPRGSGFLYTDAHWDHRRGGGAGLPVWRERFVFGERPWEVRVAATQASLETYPPRRAWLILLGGFLFTGLLGAFLLVVTSRTAQVEELVVRRTAELQNELQERQRAEGVAQLGEARNRALLEHMIGGMITFDERSRIESVNPAAETMFGYREEELIGRSIALLVADAPAADPEPYLRKAHRMSIGRLTEWWGRRKNGEVFSAEAALFEFETPEGRRFACNFQDISGRREVDRLKSEFVSTVSHELRTPLTSIRGSLGLLAAGVLGDLPQQAREIILLAERNSVRLTALINDILDFERLDSGRVEMEIAEVALQPLFEQSLESVRPVADEQRIALVSSPTALCLRADADRIVQVLVNLLSNALKFSPADSEVLLWAEAEGEGRVRIFVRDQGPGIPDAFRQRIFERFAQVETSDKRGKGGTGLGLAICKAIVEHHGGRIGVDSDPDAPGTGSVFWFEVPAAAT
jgi:PAS domain S-box-containing protein